VQDGDQFLLDFIKNKSWVDKSEDLMAVNNNNSDSDDESLAQLEKTDDFEQQYNFRFEEAVKNAESTSGADHSVMGYARSQTMNTLRRKDETRREKRLARQERKAAERKAKEEKLRRLKNAKREEMEKKMKQVKAVLGAKEEAEMLKDAPVDDAAILKLLEGDYDPDKFEKSMQEAFGDDFYSKEETEWKTDADVENTLKKDGDVDFIDADDDDDDDEQQFFDGGKERYGGEAEEGEAGDEEDEDFDDGMDEEERQKETELEKNVRRKMEDKLYELDYEDIVAGMPTRFKYRQVEANDYGLTTEEILLARDSTLKQYVSLKKMAPYSEGGEYQVSARKRRKFREMLQEDIEEANQRLKAKGITVNDNQGEDGNDPEGSRKKRKRRRLKKGTKEPNEGPESATDVPGAETEEIVAEVGNDEAGESKRRRRRKKKGKKTSSSGGLESQTEEQKTDSQKNVLSSGAKPSTVSAVSSDINLKSAAEIKKKKEKKDKQKAKKKKVAVEGISDSRLASYGL
jgi:protein KRI1